MKRSLSGSDDMVTTVKEFGSWKGVFGRHSTQVKEIATDLRSLIVGLHPETVEVPRKKENSVSFGFGTKKKNDSYCYLEPETDRVHVGFLWGAALDDVNGILNGKGKYIRHLRICDQKTARSAKVAHMVHQAVNERRIALSAGEAQAVNREISA